MEDFKKDLIKAKNQFQMIENFVDKYQPVRMQSLIGETLMNVLDVTGLEKLKAYERQIIGRMHDVILEDNGVPDLKAVKDQLVKSMNEKAI